MHSHNESVVHLVGRCIIQNTGIVPPSTCGEEDRRLELCRVRESIEHTLTCTLCRVDPPPHTHTHLFFSLPLGFSLWQTRTEPGLTKSCSSCFAMGQQLPMARMSTCPLPSGHPNAPSALNTTTGIIYTEGKEKKVQVMESKLVPGRYRYRVLDTRVLLGIGIASIHFLNDRYLKRVAN